jgi:hypothetical protein
MPRTQPNRGSHKKNVPEQHSPKANLGKVEERKQKSSASTSCGKTLHLSKILLADLLHNHLKF